MRSAGVDLVLLVPARGAPEAGSALDEAALNQLGAHFRVIRVPWVVPPDMRNRTKISGGCCGAREFVKLHAFSLTEYDAVAFLDTGVSPASRARAPPIGRRRFPKARCVPLRVCATQT